MPVGPQSFPRSGVNSLATLGARGAARLIDTLILGVPYTIVAGAVLTAVKGDPMRAADAEPLTVGEMVLLVAPYLALAVVYETIAITRWGQTIGKLALGVRVARQVNGRCPLWWEAALRVGLPAAVGVIPSPYAWMASILLFTTAGFDPMRRNAIDRAAGTVVVRSR